MIIEATFFNKGTAATGLDPLPLVYVYDLSDNSLDVDGASMTEIAMGKYKYDFSGADDTKDYTAICYEGTTLVGYDRYAFGTYSGDIGTIDATADAIKAKTDNLPADPASETNIDANETKIDITDEVVDTIKSYLPGAQTG